MKTLHKHLLTGLVIFGLGASAFAADATICGQMEPGYAHGMGISAGKDGAKLTERLQQRMNQRHAALHDKLKLNAEQEIAWKEFIAGATPPAMMMRTNHADMAKLSAPERMEKILGFMKDREAHMTARLVELKKFYAVLTPEQQKVFDAETSLRRGHRMGHRPHKAAASVPQQ
jgi:periplasmic protein CpxP/Spy